jgi:hypothetical protein
MIAWKLRILTGSFTTVGCYCLWPWYWVGVIFFACVWGCVSMYVCIECYPRGNLGGARIGSP